MQAEGCIRSIEVMANHLHLVRFIMLHMETCYLDWLDLPCGSSSFFHPPGGQTATGV